MSSTTLKKVIGVIFLLWVVAFALSRFGEYYIMKDVPEFLADMQEKLPEDPRSVARLGEDALFEHTFNIADLSKDTLNYTFLLRGTKATMKITGYATKQNGNWVPIKSDTIFAE